jgi:nucleoside-diphosphate-sugar epimerase
MNILVTGATGRIGSRFVPRLLQRGHRVRVLVRQPEQAETLLSLGVETVVGNLNQPDAIAQAVTGMEAVVHLAVFFRGVNDELSRATNEGGTLALARACIEAGVRRFVFTSTILVYAPDQDRPAREDDNLLAASTDLQTTLAFRSFLNEIGTGKVVVENALQDLFRTQGLGLRILRLGVVYGEGDRSIVGFLPRMHEYHPAKRLHMVHHADISQALLRAVTASGIDGQIYNVADDAPISIAELLRLNGLTAETTTATSSVYDPWEGIVDTLRIRDELGFRPLYPSYYTARDAGAL